MKPSEFFKREIERRELDVTYEIGLLEDLDERFIDKQEFDKKLEQLKKKPQKISSFDEHKAHLVKDILDTIDKWRLKFQGEYDDKSLNDIYWEDIEELKKKIEEIK